jgi:hypothetical protein
VSWVQAFMWNCRFDVKGETQGETL